MKSWIKYLIVTGIIIVLLVAGSLRSRSYEAEWFAFDTVVRVKILSRNPRRASGCINEIKSAFAYLDSVGSNLIDRPTYSPVLAEILKEALFVSEQTDGAFDPSIGIIEREWGRFKKPILPDSMKIVSLLKYVDYKKIRIRNDTILPGEGQVIDLGGIAKGFALDTARAIIEKYDIKSGLVYAGGDIMLVGGKGKHSWKIGVKNPRDPEGVIDTLLLKDCAVATSGDYERYFIINGKRYHHILNTETGYPAKGLVSVTCIHNKGMLADAYATAIFVLGKEKGIEFAKKNKIRVELIDSSLKIIKIW